MPIQENKIMVSIVVCAYNRENYIRETLNSILSQKVSFNFEILIGDDGSTDGTRELCLEYKKQYEDIIKLYFHKENCGLGKNWAILVEESKGKYIASCDDDDYWHNPLKLQIQVEYLEKNIDHGMVHTEIDRLYEPHKRLQKNYYSSRGIHIKEGTIHKDIFYGHVPICVSSAMLRSCLLKKYVPLEVYKINKFNIQDWPTWVLIGKRSKIGYIPISCTTYRVGHSAISNLQSFEKIEKKTEIDQKMYEIICGLLINDFVYNKEVYNQYRLNILLSFAYKRFDFNKANSYISLLWNYKDRNMKIKMARSKLTFIIYALALHLKKTILKCI